MTTVPEEPLWVYIVQGVVGVLALVVLVWLVWKHKVRKP